MFVPHSNNNANSYHTYTEVKKNYMLKVSMTLGEFGPDIKEALKAESDLLLKQPTRKMITLPLGVTNPGTLGPQGDDESIGTFTTRQQMHETAVEMYKAAVENQKFEQETENMSYKAAVSEHTKRENARRTAILQKPSWGTLVLTSSKTGCQALTIPASSSSCLLAYTMEEKLWLPLEIPILI